MPLPRFMHCDRGKVGELTLDLRLWSILMARAQLMTI